MVECGFWVPWVLSGFPGNQQKDLKIIMVVPTMADGSASYSLISFTTIITEVRKWEQAKETVSSSIASLSRDPVTVPSSSVD
jgi:hypothetical protein